jgi:hypothetical protein
MKEDEMGGTHGMNGAEQKFSVLWENTKERERRAQMTE